MISTYCVIGRGAEQRRNHRDLKGDAARRGLGDRTTASSSGHDSQTFASSARRCRPGRAAPAFSSPRPVTVFVVRRPSRKRSRSRGCRMRIDSVVVPTSWWGQSVSIEGNRRRTIAGGDAVVGAWSVEAWSATAIASSLGPLRLGSLVEAALACTAVALASEAQGRRGLRRRAPRLVSSQLHPSRFHPPRLCPPRIGPPSAEAWAASSRAAANFAHPAQSA